MADGASMTAAETPTEEISVRDAFGIDTDMVVKGFAERTERVPDIDDAYVFDRQTTLAILAGFAHNRRVMIQGYHGTGKSTHIEQVAARLNWPCIRINLDSHISRIDLDRQGRHQVLKDGKQVTEFQRRVSCPGRSSIPTALVFDEYDAGRPGCHVRHPARARGRRASSRCSDQNRVIRPHPAFRLFSTTNTIGLGGHDRPLPRHAADQPGPDGPLVDRDHAELSAP